MRTTVWFYLVRYSGRLATIVHRAFKVESGTWLRYRQSKRSLNDCEGRKTERKAWQYGPKTKAAQQES